MQSGGHLLLAKGASGELGQRSRPHLIRRPSSGSGSATGADAAAQRLLRASAASVPEPACSAASWPTSAARGPADACCVLCSDCGQTSTSWKPNAGSAFAASASARKCREGRAQGAGASRVAARFRPGGFTRPATVRQLLQLCHPGPSRQFNLACEVTPVAAAPKRSAA